MNGMKNRTQSKRIFALLWIGAVFLAGCTALEPAIISGVVLDEHGPLVGAVVRVQATEISTLTDDEGAFNLDVSDLEEGTYKITAWADGYFVGWVENVLESEQPIEITLNRYYTTDNPDYNWFSMEGEEGSITCSHCMPCYEEWIQDAHSQSAVNPRFLTMYNGTDVQGNQSPFTRFGYNRDYGSFPLRPDPNEPYYGPGYKLDFPFTAGNCSTCHVPVQSAKPGMAYAADPNLASGIEVESVFCEFCHKIGGVTLNPATGLPYPNMPGTLSMTLYRPSGDQQLFLANFDDVTRRVSYSSLYEQSQYCASCHFGVFWDTVVYDSFGEWLRSPYSDPETGKTCQDCHMPNVDYDYFVYPEKGGLTRDNSRIFSHLMPGAQDEEFLKNAVTMAVDAHRDGDAIVVQVDITNDNTGHDIPTDSPLRQLILLVSATSGDGKHLQYIDGPILPEWAGVGEVEQGYYAGQPGVAYAKILQELWTEISPSGAYWNPTRILSDNRIAALETASSTYTFSAPQSGSVQIEVRLLYRRAFIELMDWKGWDIPDIELDSQSYVVN
jgi:hypothetical protein